MKKALLYISITTIALVFAVIIAIHFVNYTPAYSTFYKSSPIPFYMEEQDEGYAEYKKLKGGDYWNNLSNSLDQYAKEYCLDNSIDSVEIDVTCMGEPTYYSVGYTVSGAVSFADEYKLKDLISLLVEEVEDVYGNSLDIMGQSK